MAVTATSLGEQMAFEGMEVKMAYKQVESAVILRLTTYRQNLGRIKVLQKQANGIGLGMYLQTTTRPFDGEDQLRALHKQLAGLPEWMYLSQHEQDLVSIYRVYLHDRDFSSMRTALAALRKTKGDDEADQQMLTELARRIARALDEAYQRHTYRNPDELAVGRADARLAAEVELDYLLHEKELVETAIEQLGFYDEKFQTLIRMRYVEGKSALETRTEINVAEKTLERMKKKAITQMAYLLGING